MAIARQSFRTAIVAISAFALCSIAAAARSRGFIESDGATHFIFARHAIEQPIYFVDIWGRPLCTALFSIPARLGGLFAVRLTSMLAAIACAVIAAAIARGQGFRYPALALIFTLGQPLLFLHSFSELTELPFAVVLGLAFLSYQRRRYWAMAIFAAIGPLGRPEGFVFLILADAALIGHRKWLPLFILPMGLIAWSIAGHVLVGPADRPWWRWLVDHWPYESGSEYPRGPLLYFAGVLPMVVGSFALPAVWIGMWWSLESGWPVARLKEHLPRVNFLIAALPLAILTGHSLLHWLGKLSSSGAPRYLLIVAPLWGCLAVRGWEWAFSRMRWPRPMSWAALAVVVPGLVNYYWRVLPVQQTPSWDKAETFSQWYQHSELRQKFPRIMSNHPGVFFYFERQSMGSEPGGAVVAGGNRSSEGTGSVGMGPGVLHEEFGSKLVATLDRLEKSGWVDNLLADWACGVNGSEFSGNLSQSDWHLLSRPK